MLPDGRQLVNRARDETNNYRSTFGETMPADSLCRRVSQWVHLHTMYGSVRPFGCSVILGSYDRDGPRLYSVEPSGTSWGYFATAIGKGANLAKTELEKLKLAEMTCREALVHVARIVLLCHEENKEKAFDIEMSWVCDESNRQHQFVPENLRQAALAAAKAQVENA